MKITTIRWYSVENKLTVPFVTSLRRVEELESLVLVFGTDDGRTACGGAAPTKAITGEDLDTLQAAFAGPVREICQGADPANHEEVMARLAAALPRQSSARAAVSIALYNLLADAAGRPLYELLGPDHHCPPTSFTLSLESPEEMARQAAAASARGFSLHKVKLGGGDGLDGPRLAAVVRAAAPGTRFRLDPNQGWTPDEALRLLTLFKGKALPIDFVEQPLPAADLAGMAALRREGLFPVVADESVFSPADAARVIDAGAADIINIKLMKTGGLSAALAICRLAEAAGLGVMVGSMLEGAASVLAAIHLATADPAVTVTDLDAPLLFKELPQELAGVYRENGTIALP